MDVRNDHQECFTIHCPNSGSMKGLLEEGAPVYFSTSSNPKRKLPHTVEIIQSGSTLVGVNTHRANTIVGEALHHGLLQEYYPHTRIKPEHTVDHSRFDFMLETPKGSALLEVKNVTLADGHCALFPDAVTARGTKHINHLCDLAKKGMQCAMIFLVQRNDCTTFSPAQHIDPVYTEAFNRARQHVAVHILACTVTEHSIVIDHHDYVAPGHELPQHFRH